MTQDEFNNLTPGDIISSKETYEEYIVSHNLTGQKAVIIMKMTPVQKQLLRRKTLRAKVMRGLIGKNRKRTNISWNQDKAEKIEKLIDLFDRNSWDASMDTLTSARDEIARMQGQLHSVASSLSKAIFASGISNDQDLTSPHLLLLGEDLLTEIARLQGMERTLRTENAAMRAYVRYADPQLPLSERWDELHRMAGE